MRGVFQLLVLIISSCALAQNCTTYTVVDAIDRKTGDDVANLNVQDFEARVGGHPLSVISVTPNYSNRLLVLLETDGNSDRIEEVVSLATRLARQAPEGRRLAFGVFAKRSLFTKDFFSDPEERGRAINAVIEDAPTLGNKVALYDALHNALAVFGAHQPGDTVMVVADGYDDGSDKSGPDIENEYLAHNTKLLVMLRQTPSRVTGNFMWRNPELDRVILEHATARTGGLYTMFDAYAFGLGWRGYMLGVDVPQGGDKSHKWKLRLHWLTQKSRKRPNLYYSEQLPPCAATLTEDAKHNDAPVKGASLK
jgi:hypothetical protein